MSPQIKTDRVNLGAIHRVPICVRALVIPQSHGLNASEHLTFALSITDVLLSGHSEMMVGAKASVYLFFDNNQIARVSGKTVRVLQTVGRPQFVVQFDSIHDANHQLVQKKVDAAFVGNASPTVLLLRTTVVRETRWLDALRDRCRVVQKIEQLAETVSKYPVETVIVGSDYNKILDRWSARYPEIVWRSIDVRGRLRG